MNERKNMKCGITMLIISTVLLYSCNTSEPNNQYNECLQDFEGEYEVIEMDWTHDGGEVIGVDIDNDGVGSNELVSEILPIIPRSNWPNSRFVPNYDCGEGTLYVNIPIIDYHFSEGSSTPDLPMRVFSPEFALHATVTDGGSLSSDMFLGLDRPEEDSLAQKTFGGVEIRVASHNRIELRVEHYLVYDYVSSKKLEGSLVVWLSKTALFN